MNFKTGFLMTIGTLCLAPFSFGQTVAKSGKPEVKIVTKRATGTFEVKVTPVAAEENVGDPTIGRLALDKQFSGALTASSKGQMLGFQGEPAGTGGYVAMERLNGTLDGKKGGFLLQHVGTMADGKFDLNIAVVPGSGTGELVGISGKMTIVIEGGKHSFVLEYSLPKPK
ncbi:MAG: DUF3224 domain-containing protein [Pyrinomonadaceae bacterium]|nr:DUF3224 domain-containing protein [Pyrinomonadaceae bacterium]MBP9108643.1 DUF3224 domain-containing protein [Pyrinomonadaceae bacterium]